MSRDFMPGIDYDPNAKPIDPDVLRALVDERANRPKKRPLRITGCFEEAVMLERERQRQKWGDDFDDDHGALEWTAILCMEAVEFGKAGSLEDCKRELVHVAAVARAAYDAMERAEAKRS